MYLQLLNLNTHAVIYSYDMDKQTIDIKDDFLKKDLENNGVKIPEGEGEFAGRVVKLGDSTIKTASFHQAFFKYYQPIKNLKEFAWKVIE